MAQIPSTKKAVFVPCLRVMSSRSWDVSVCVIVSQGNLDDLDDFYAFVNKVDDSVIIQRDGRITG